MIIKQIKNWLPKIHQEFKAEKAELEAQVPKQNFEPLKGEILEELQHKIDNLNSPDCYIETIVNSFNSQLNYLQRIQNNTLVVLGNPVENFCQIFEDLSSILSQELSISFKVHMLCLDKRQEDHTKIKTQLVQELDYLQNHHQQSESTQMIVFIPDLSLLFLRCVDGLDAIEYLQNLFFNQRSIFWVVGCNKLAWPYFDIVFKLKNYLPEVIELPKLEPLDLKKWLAPIGDYLEFEWPRDPTSSNSDGASGSDSAICEDDDWHCDEEKKFFENLSDISLGISHVATGLWLRSWGRSLPDEDQPSETDSQPQIILQRVPSPRLPNLSKDDHYILFSLCLHKEISLSQLALTLGEIETRTQHQLQFLWRNDLIQSQDNLWKINPIYFPQLRKDLVKNNFFIDS